MRAVLASAVAKGEKMSDNIGGGEGLQRALILGREQALGQALIRGEILRTRRVRCFHERLAREVAGTVLLLLK